MYVYIGLRPANFIKRKTLIQVLFCEFCEIFKNNFFTEHLQTTGSDDSHRSSPT